MWLTNGSQGSAGHDIHHPPGHDVHPPDGLAGQRDLLAFIGQRALSDFLRVCAGRHANLGAELAVDFDGDLDLIFPPASTKIGT
jgi:hypothetical protein